MSALRPAGAAAGQGRRGNRADDAAAPGDARTRLANAAAIVRVVTTDGTIESRDVRVGLVSRVSAQILSGLDAGERIVVGERTAASGPTAKPATVNRPMMPPRV